MHVLDGALRSIAAVTSAIIALSFVLFAAEEVRDASDHQVAAVAPGPDRERARAARHTTAREAIDDVNDVVLAPFAGAVGDTGNRWARRGVPALIGLLVYGLGLAYLARRLDVRGHTFVRHPAAAAPPPPPGESSSPPPGPA